MRKKGKTGHYEVDQSNLISRIKEDLFEIILNPTKENIRRYTKNFINKCIHSPNKVKESKKYKTAEDALLIMYISHVKEYVTEKVAGSASVTVNLLIRDGNSFDILSINRDRLRYKFEVVANRFGFTTKGRVGLSLDNFWYNLYPLEDTNQ